jgi:uncharacterized membrane protein YphA (DoxX/SURF4 family)
MLAALMVLAFGPGAFSLDWLLKENLLRQKKILPV